MNTEPSRAYSPAGIESRIYRTWLDRGCFHATSGAPDRSEPFCMVIPPPNVTGALHLGHAINNTLQDILVRRKRMQGRNTLWMPGVDHAGIATQAVVERKLFEEEKKTRHDLGREALVQRIWDWKQQYGNRIVEQLKLMGCSCDWQRERFTLDEVCARAVREWFFRLFRDGLIFRGKRLVNWDTHLQTAVADDEVYHETVKGHLWQIRYPVLRDGAGAPGSDVSAEVRDAAMRAAAAESAIAGRDYLVVATTRPETLLADTAVAVHPEDERYLGLIGRQVLLPQTGRSIPVIADGLLVKREFGTGCVKVTPGHDPNDYGCFQRHPQIGIRTMMTPDGRVMDDHAGFDGRYRGLKLDEARKRLVADLESAGLLHKTEDYVTEVGHSDRSKTPIQPYLSDQWFVKMGDLTEDEAAVVQSPFLRTLMTRGAASNGGRPEAARDKEQTPHLRPGLAQAAIDALCDDDAHYETPEARKECQKVHIFPRRYGNTYRDWLAEKRDWCISRQLWWGHRIPVWHAPHEFETRPVQDLTPMILQLRSWAFEGRQHGVMRTRFEDTPTNIEFDESAPSFFNCVREPDGKDREIVQFLDQRGYKQDPDVLDTWFSSALWPLSTMGWPGPTAGPIRGEPEPELFKTFYPTSTLSTAREIITLWVARMVIASLHNTGRVPFRDVVIHPVIMDGQGRQMKKSLGNGVDPVDLIEMYGADALRFTLAAMTTETQDVRIPVKKVTLPSGRDGNASEKFELGRNFCNKLWQAATGFILPNVEGMKIERFADGYGYRHTHARPQELPLFDRWIRTRLNRCIRDVDEALDGYLFARAMDRVRDFFWTEFCDWYLEESKLRLLRGPDAGAVSATEANDVKVVLLQVLDTTLQLLHPFVPFITEAIWEEIGRRVPHQYELVAGDAALAKVRPGQPVPQPLLIEASWPQALPLFDDERCDREVSGVLQPVIQALRQARTDINAVRSRGGQPAVRTLPTCILRAGAEVCRILGESGPLVRRMGGVDAMEISAAASKPPRVRSHVAEGFELYVPLADLIDLKIEEQRLKSELAEKQAALQRASAQLANEGFVSRAAPEAVAETRARETELTRQCRLIEQHLADLG